jgi:hypothetical protein
MADFYPYLVSSLPMLHFGMKPPFSFERFIELCSDFTPEKDFQVLSFLPKPEEYMETGEKPAIIRKWIEFDAGLRNELVRIRAVKKNTDPAPYLRPESLCAFTGSLPVITGDRTASLPDVEKVLDEIRWKGLEELATNHYFDLDFLITYAYKLLILLRWEKIRTAEGQVLLKQAMAREGNP